MSNPSALQERIATTEMLIEMIEQRDVLTPEEAEERLVLKARLKHQQRALEALQ